MAHTTSVYWPTANGHSARHAAAPDEGNRTRCGRTLPDDTFWTEKAPTCQRCRRALGLPAQTLTHLNRKRPSLWK